MSGGPMSGGAAARERGARAGTGPWAARAEDILHALLAVAVSLSIAATEIVFWSLVLLRLAVAARGQGLVLRPRSVAWTWAALAVSWLLAGAFSPEPWPSLLRVHKLYLVYVVFLVAEHASDARRARRLVACYLAGAALGSLYGLVSSAPGLARMPALWRLEGAFSTAMTAGNVLATGFVAAFAAFLTQRGALRGAAAGSGALVAAALAATRTRSSWIGALAGAALVGVLGCHRRWALAGLLGLVLLGSVTPGVRERAVSAVDLGEYDVRGRVSLWRTGWDLFHARPLVGWGLADQKRRIGEHRRADATFVAGHFHNNVVQVAVTGGGLGLLAYLAFHGALAGALWRGRRRPWAAAALGAWTCFHIAGLFDWSFGDVEVVYHFMFWMGLGLADNGAGGAKALVDPPHRP